MIEAPRTNHETLMNVLKRTVGDTEAVIGIEGVVVAYVAPSVK